MAKRLRAPRNGGQSATKTVRVLMLVENNSYPRDPRVRKEAQALESAGYAVTVIAPAETNQRWRENVNGINVYRFPAPPPGNGMLGYLYEYAYSMVAIFLLSIWVFVRHGFDVIHAANPPDTLVLIAAFYKCLGARFIFDHHDLAPEMYYARFPQGGNRFVYRALLFCEKLSCRLADQIFAVNESYKSFEINRCGVQAERIAIVRNGPVLKAVDQAEPKSDLRSSGATIIAYAGIIGVQDGVDGLLHAVRQLVFDLRRTNLLCVIIGNGDALPGLKQLAQELDITRYVQFTGWVSDPDEYARYIASADICVDPSPSNAYNDCCTAIKMMEYMAAAKAIVAFDLPEHRFTAESCAVYANPHDRSGFARAIAELIDDPRRRQQMGAAGRQRIEQRLAWDFSVPVLLQAYSRLFSESAVQTLSTVEARDNSVTVFQKQT